MNTYIALPLSGGGSSFYLDPVSSFADLPDSDTTGALRLVSDEGTIYYYDGDSWQPVTELLTQQSTTDTNSVDLTVTNGVLSADLKLSAASSGVGNLSPTLTIETDGLKSRLPVASVRGVISATGPVAYDAASGTISLPAASASVDGYLDNADFATFAAKEPAITAGTTTQFYRGDKTFATLSTAALSADTGTVATAGAIGEVITGTQAANTTTNLGATGTYGYVTSVDLTAGSWQLNGVVGFNENGATLSNGYECGISNAANGVGISEFNTTLAPFLVTGNSDAVLPTPAVYVTIGAPATYYLNTRFFYSAGTPRHRGRLIARRIR